MHQKEGSNLVPVPSNAVIKVPKKQKKTYAKMFKKAGFKGKVK